MSGSGIKKKVRFGKGITSDQIKCKINEHDLGKFYLEKDKLENNILALKYKSTRNTHPNLRLMRISNDVKEVIIDIIKGKYDERLFRKLKPLEKDIVNNVVMLCKLPIDLDPNETKQFQKQYEILVGEYRSGNDNNEVKAKLKEYILYGLNLGKIRRSEALNLLYELSL
jgi:hypothetical protein